MDDVFQALSAPARRAILDALRDGERQTLFELCTRLIAEHGVDLSRQAVSQHLAVLEEAGLVTTVQEGKYRFIAIRREPLVGLTDRWLEPGAAGKERKQP